MAPPSDRCVDHRDGNGLNNRRNNVRVCTPQQNQQAMGVTRRNRLGVKGVYPTRGGFGANICFNRKNYNLGRYDTIEEAKAAYDKRANELFGDFAKP
jgi:hypothetical protein